MRLRLAVGEIDKLGVRRSFQRAAALYDQAAVIQQRMVDELIVRLDVLNIAPRYIVDVGCGTGYAQAGLRQRFPDAHIIMLDFAANMLQQLPTDQSALTYAVCGDAEMMPIASNRVDMIFCSAVLQYCDFEIFFAECLRLLKPQGLLTFATFGPDTLKELRAAWQQVDAGMRVQTFADMHNIGDALVQLQFSMPVLDVDYVTVTHKLLPSAFNDLRALGASNSITTRARGLLGKDRYHQLLRACDGYRNDQGLLESTCEIVYGHAWAPEQLNINQAGGEVAIPLSQLHRR